MRSGVIPSLIHQAASRDSPPIAELANGAQLSVRIACSYPYSRKAASKMVRTRSVLVFATVWQCSR